MQFAMNQSIKCNALCYITTTVTSPTGLCVCVTGYCLPIVGQNKVEKMSSWHGWTGQNFGRNGASCGPQTTHEIFIRAKQMTI